MALPDAEPLIPPSGYVLSAAGMRAAERSLFARGIDSFALMRKAGLAVAADIQRTYARSDFARVLVLCGPGNNGGDGFITAEELRRAGWPVSVLAMRAIDTYRGDAGRAAKAWQGACTLLSAGSLADNLGGEVLIVDALFGIGLDRPLTGTAAAGVEMVTRARHPVIAIDIASGVSSDSGQVLGVAFDAVRTITFGWAKPGHLLFPGRQHTGNLSIAVLDFDADSLAAAQPVCEINAPVSWRWRLPVPGPFDHKYSRGHALVVGGGEMSGAGRLAARAARRIGAGMMTVAAPPDALALYFSDQPGLLGRGFSRAEDLVDILMDRRIAGALVGSGLPPDRPTREAVLTILSAARPTVIDGGGLTAFADRPEDLFIGGRGDIVLTPHEGEFERLFPDLGRHLGKLDRARQAAVRSRSVLVVKGADTVIAAPDGRAFINLESSPYLATAGSGDVLAGLVLGLLVQGMPPLDAAAAAVWIHGRAGIACGPGLIAEDLPERVPAILAELVGAR